MDVKRVFSGTPARPAELLLRRESRATRQRELLESGCSCLISFTLNIPGAIKQFPLARAAFADGLAQLHFFFKEYMIAEETVELVTGCEAFLTLSLPAKHAKEIAVSVETLHPLGRLFDIDILLPSGQAVSRTDTGLPRRKCLLCGQDAKICGRTRAHSITELQQWIGELLNSYFRDQAAQRCAVQAARAMLTEVSATPKPGLVDRMNSGAHQDMDFFTFLDSSTALSPWFSQMFCVGWDHSDATPQQLFHLLRFVGRQAESAMLLATGGVNTQKGLIFSLGLLCGALGSLHARHFAPPPLNAVLALCGEMGHCACQDFSNSAAATNGLNCYRTYQVAGIRGEAAAGFPSAVMIGLPSLQKLCAAGRSLNDAAAITLMRLLAEVDDTNMIKRGGLETAKRCRKQANDILQDTENISLAALTQLDHQYIQNNLSPGGCADLLAISLMLFFSSLYGLTS